MPLPGAGGDHDAVPGQPERERGVRRVRAPVLGGADPRRCGPRRRVRRVPDHPRGARHLGRRAGCLGAADEQAHRRRRRLAAADCQPQHAVLGPAGAGDVRAGAVHEGPQRQRVLQLYLELHGQAGGAVPQQHRRRHQGLQLLPCLPAAPARHHPAADAASATVAFAAACSSR